MHPSIDQYLEFLSDGLVSRHWVGTSTEASGANGEVPDLGGEGVRYVSTNSRTSASLFGNEMQQMCCVVETNHGEDDPSCTR
jgi:hypothetical protein